ncbi:MAG: dihydrodipicolinate synthase family protein [candidate division KSB1 bacterium]|nr:dihydrodipicolinate synthase family protein [candidate division KSB1 bacterium]MDZ7301687.1 dihydrodipicolinate synthase family protein [candidate division KSB1 bacterium]MDZ7312426.1 dihydrodipicolinate synthase family protein [candidate division KSB1 bacterium]
MKLDLQGIFPPIPTAFENGRLAPHRLQENLTKWNDTGLSGYLVLGSNGEAPLLTETEKRELVHVARKAIPSEKILLVGSGLEATDATSALTNRLADLGADAALIITPSYYRDLLTPEALRRHFETVAEASPIPIILYNVPQVTGISLPIEVVASLAQHPNVIGMKDSSGNLGQLVELREKVPSHFQLLIGTYSVLLGGLVHGVRGAIVALANVAPRECVELFNAVEDEKWDVAQALANRLAPVGRAVTTRFGVPGLKAALDELGYFGGEPRPPLLPVSDKVRTEIRSILQQASLLE